jgi:hypothetical protein
MHYKLTLYVLDLGQAFNYLGYCKLGEWLEVRNLLDEFNHSLFLLFVYLGQASGVVFFTDYP